MRSKYEHFIPFVESPTKHNGDYNYANLHLSSIIKYDMMIHQTKSARIKPSAFPNRNTKIDCVVGYYEEGLVMIGSSIQKTTQFDCPTIWGCSVVLHLDFSIHGTACRIRG